MRLHKKFILVFIATAVAIFTGSVRAQAKNKAFDQIIMVPAHEIRIDSLMKIFSKQTGIEFSFNSNKITPSRKITVPAKRQTLSQWLDLLNRTIGVQHKLVGNHIILIDNSSKASGYAPAKPKTPNKTATIPRVEVKKQTADKTTPDKTPVTQSESTPDQKLSGDTITKSNPISIQASDSANAINTPIQKQNDSVSHTNRPVNPVVSDGKSESGSTEKNSNPFPDQDKTEAVQLIAGYSRHGSGDMNGIVFGAEYTRYLTRKFSLNYNLRATINDKDESMPIYTAPGIREKAYMASTTAGVQLGVNAGLSIINTLHSEFVIRLGGFARYQSASIGSTGYSNYPTSTGLISISSFNDNTPRKTYAVGGLLQLQYNFIFRNKTFMGLIGAFQTDTNGDAIPQVALAIGKTF